jgi:hypothetical protein
MSTPSHTDCQIWKWTYGWIEPGCRRQLKSGVYEDGRKKVDGTVNECVVVVAVGRGRRETERR